VIDVAIVGAPGYAGVELTRLVIGHPTLRPTVLTSVSDAGRGVGEVYPALAPYTEAVYVEPHPETIGADASVVFLAVPHTAALGIVPSLLEKGLTVIDASADFRFEDPEVYERWYGLAHTAPELLAEAVYGLPELGRASLEGARLVACPGCYPTATLLAALPAFEEGICSGDRVIVDAKSGVSGVGRTPGAGSHFPAVNESIAPYKVAVHRHTPEIDQGLSAVSGKRVHAVLTPHLVPMTRGLLATVYMEVSAPLSAAEAVASYRARYDDEPFITVHEAGRMPATSEVRGSNRAHIGLAVDESAGMLIAACAIDNLVKGTAGQAIQCANIVLGLDETAGLVHPVPVV